MSDTTTTKALDKHGLAEVRDSIRVAFPQASGKVIGDALRVLRKGNRANGGA